MVTIRFGKTALAAALGFALTMLPAPARADLVVRLSPSAPAPLPAGSTLTWKAKLFAPGRKLLFRFETSAQGGAWQVVQDYGPGRSLEWTSLVEGQYQVRLSVLDTEDGTTVSALSNVRFTSHVTTGVPVVSPTHHPLVALYSAPACPTGSVQVRFRPQAGTTWQSTPAQACQGSLSLNFYVAGMLADTTYVLQQQRFAGGTTIPGPELTFHTGSPAFPLPVATLAIAPDAATSSDESVMLTSFDIPAPYRVSTQVGPVATDLAGNLLWYDPRMVGRAAWGSYLARAVPGGTMLLMLGHQPDYGQMLREVDLAGITRRETTVDALNRQLAQMGKDLVSYLSHDALRLPNDHTLVLAPVERILADVEGSAPRDILGYSILDLDPNFQVTWTWNAFDFLDPHRRALLHELCAMPACGPLRLGQVAQDWIHGNSLVYLPDGNILMSMRHQDWIVKIDYRNGAGTGDVLWRLGAEGDFDIVSGDPSPWFSHQHGIEMSADGLVVFDNGNTRVGPNGNKDGHSRGQVLVLDEANAQATLTVNADLGIYSAAWGNGQRLANGNFFFTNGFIPPITRLTTQVREITPDGGANYTMKWGQGAYRAFRMKDIYTP